jgi:hypothetical protein
LSESSRLSQCNAEDLHADIALFALGPVQKTCDAEHISKYDAATFEEVLKCPDTSVRDSISSKVDADEYIEHHYLISISGQHVGSDRCVPIRASAQLPQFRYIEKSSRSRTFLRQIWKVVLQLLGNILYESYDGYKKEIGRFFKQE